MPENRSTEPAPVDDRRTEALEVPAQQALQHLQPASGLQSKVQVPFIKPANDDMEYRHLVLPNGLRVLLLSDPTTDKAGAAMDVCAGSLSDPDDFPGLAHFTEHMLFFSSEKYPVEDEYTKFISNRGGTTNAYTSAEHTNYHFDINWDALEGALDRFAQFFIAPTISQDGVEREVLAVDSEHRKNLSSDAWRKSQVNKATANCKHPWARFSSGNRDTLYTRPLAAGADPRAAVADFYARHYSADRCALAVMGRQTVEELEAMVRGAFSTVPNKSLPRPEFEDDVFLPAHTSMLLRVVPVREGQSLEVTWQVPPSQRLFREQPLGYLSHLLGHEGDGSVFALLKASGWASALWAGESGGGLSFVSFFTVHVDLTEEGQRNIRDVATTIFRYLALLKRPGGICRRTWEEVRGLAQLQFDNRDRSKPMNYTTSLANALQSYPAQELLPALYGVPREFSPGAISEALELLTPRRARLFWVSKVHQKTEPGVGDQEQQQTGVAEAQEGKKGGQEEESRDTEWFTEPWYGTRYGVGALPADWLSAWEAAVPEDEPSLHLPVPNRFIPTDLSLADDEAAAAPPHPEVVVAVPGRLRLWHKPDTRFRQPKAVLYLDVQCPEAYTSPRAAVMTRLFVKLMLDYMNEVAYPAQQAGLDYNMLNTQSGWQLLLGGYNHKLPELMEEVLRRLSEFKILPDRFKFVRESLVREYSNQMHNQPYSWAMYRAEMLTTARRWPIEVYGSVATSVTEDELQAHVRRLCNRCFVEGLAAGNLRRSAVLACGASLLACLRDSCGTGPLHPGERADLRCLQLTPPPPPPPQQTSPPQQVVRAAAAAEAPAGAGAELVEAVEVAPSGAPEPAGAAGEGGAGASVVVGEGGYRTISGGWLWAEDGPSGTDENSAGLVMYQVGPDFPRSNALRSLLVHLAKREAFSELRTKQQLGYIVSLHGGAEHGVGYMEMLVQSSAYDAEELCVRMDDFMGNMVERDLLIKCGLAPPAASTSEVPADTAATITEAASAGAADGTTHTPAPAAGEPTEFETAVEELAKTKLQAPKKLADLTNRWWSEIEHGFYCFDRREKEVDVLRSVTPSELVAFARELLAGADARRLTIQVRGTGEAARRQKSSHASSEGAATTTGAPQASEESPAGPSGDTQCGPASSATTTPACGCAGEGAQLAPRRPYTAIPRDDPYTWKRSCPLHPSVRSLWAAQRTGSGQSPVPVDVAVEEVEGLVAAAAGRLGPGATAT